jgi:hypothetical protein
MSRFKIEFYNATSGVVFEKSWSNEKDYQKARAFLQDRLGDPAGTAPGEPVFYYIATKEQLEAVHALRHLFRPQKD